ncbi:MAG: hypothetical protein WBW84_02835 [Acidobacteriaceae bacterium]
MQQVEAVERAGRPIPLSLIFATALAVHLPLLLMELPLRSYDTNLHIFFASHYLHHWFDPWNTKWYAGFSQTTYLPVPQQWIAIVSHITGLVMGYMVVQLAGILLLVLGVYRFSRLWVSERAASFAALATVFVGAESFLVYAAGQLSTTCAAPLYLNAMPFLFEWIRYGRWKAFLKALVLLTAAAATHSATLVFGSLLFALPVVALAFFDREDGKRVSGTAFTFRTIFVTVAVGAAVAAVLLPFWIALLRYPVTQVPIPHASRANYILSPQWGINYFIVPYGAMILALPFIIFRGAAISRLRPLLFGFWLAFLLGLGGTTPVGYYLLGRAFNVITMERFTYWASLLALPIVGMLASELVARFRMRAALPLGAAAALTCAVAVCWSTYYPPEGVSGGFKVNSCALWLNRDGHDRYRYITLGFGNQIARLAMLTDAGSVDGEWNSGRLLPELMAYGSGPLTDSKHYGDAGMDALRAMLRHADKYGIRWVMVKDHYYDPLLAFAGWRHVDSLENDTIYVWGNDSVPPATAINAPQRPPHWQGIWWGTLPFGSSLLALLLVLIPGEPIRAISEAESAEEEETVAHGRMAS